MEKGTPTKVTERLAGFACSTDFSTLEGATIHQAKRCLLDTLSAIIAGSNERFPSILEAYTRKRNPSSIKEATIILSKLSASAPDAAFVNGAKAHCLDFDDGHRFAAGHPGAVVIPAALAAGELVNSTGKEIIAAIVGGYEVFIRIGSSINPGHLRRGFHTTATCGVFGSAVAAGKLLDLNAAQMENSLALAAVEGSGLLRVVESGAEAKPFQVGRASQAGVLAALLAREGVQGPDKILEGEMGFVGAMTDHCDYEGMIDGLGTKFMMLQTYVKLYPVCRHIHAAIDGALSLKFENEFNATEIQDVLVETYRTSVDLTGRLPRPKSVAQARFSLPYCIGIALSKDNFVEGFSEGLDDPSVNRIAEHTKVIVEQRWESMYPAVRGMSIHIRLKDGRVLERNIETPKGEPENPVTDEELEKKFIGSAAGKMHEDEIKSTIDKIAILEKLSQFSELMKSLR